MSPAYAPVRRRLPHALPRDNNTLDDKAEEKGFNWLLLPARDDLPLTVDVEQGTLTVWLLVFRGP
jgi:hypothetical protein